MKKICYVYENSLFFDFYKNILNIKGKNVYYWRAANESENFIPFLNTSNYYPILDIIT